MEITNDSLPWTSEDIDNLRSFFKTQTGQRVVPKVLESVPPLMQSGDTNAILIRCGEVRGIQVAVQALLGLTVYPPPPESPSAESYPDLHNDAVWNDGHKVSETPTNIL